ncbi:lia operon protein LiaF [Bacillus pakistanensis]|uniref:Lia operon protein LiaF n=1 Tax=Rossellomorea pakistanensis TaxID=992288 RepID=A0ABS2NJ56_9BACI|nr:cell wall-active antibiotics response protein LiaF [Bacillus pakistanensis]MBM7587886.1 lia operon protein LiaF [Bacillus pakistanensis]
MLNRLNTDKISWVLIIGLLLLVFEISFFNGEVIFPLLFQIACIYFGRKRMPKTSGKLIFWFGVITLVITIFNTIAFKFFLIAIMIYIIIQFAESKKNPERIKPKVNDTIYQGEEEVFTKKSNFQNTWFGHQQTPEHVYEWDDINVQGGFGDNIIDLSYTVLPKGTSIISIRKIIGNVRILVPYDVEVSIHHTVMAGKVKVFEHQVPKVINQSIQFQTAQYEQSSQNVKIITSMFVGDIEVKRV